MLLHRPEYWPVPPTTSVATPAEDKFLLHRIVVVSSTISRYRRTTHSRTSAAGSIHVTLFGRKSCPSFRSTEIPFQQFTFGFNRTIRSAPNVGDRLRPQHNSQSQRRVVHGNRQRNEHHPAQQLTANFSPTPRRTRVAMHLRRRIRSLLTAGMFILPAGRIRRRAISFR